jgi:hypothetical protein
MVAFCECEYVDEIMDIIKQRLFLQLNNCHLLKKTLHHTIMELLD